MMHTIEHPPLEDLTKFIYSSYTDELQDLNEHISECHVCQTKIVEIKKLLIDLEQGKNLSNEDVPGFYHISDQQLNDYTYQRLSSTEMELVKAHLLDCDLCLKASMRLKTHLADKKLKDLEQMDSVSISFDEGSNISNEQKKYNLHEISLSIAAGALLIVLGFYVSKYLETEKMLIDRDISTKLVSSQQSTHLKAVSLDYSSHAGYQKTENGLLNWYEGYVETTAVGTVDMSKMVNEVQAEIVAEKTARHIAYAQLAEMLGGVHVTQNSVYKELLVKADDISIKNEKFIKGAKLINKKIDWLKGSPKAEVTMRLPLNGKSSLQTLIEKNDMQKLDGKRSEKLSNVVAANLNYSSVLLDLRDTEFTPSLYINLESQNLPPMRLKAQYYTDHTDSEKRRFMGNEPYVIKAKSLDNLDKIVLNDQDSTIVASLLKKQRNLNEVSLPVLY